jgi:GWxTD domain-containing protein
MKKRLLYVIALLLLLTQRTTALDIGVSYAIFATPDESYIEINLEIAPLTITWQPVDSFTLQAGAEVLILIKKGEEIIAFEKYMLNSPVVDAPQTLLDVKRLSVPNGSYTVEITVQDIRNPINKDLFKTDVSVLATPGVLRLSEVQLLRTFRADNSESLFTKNGFYLEPLPFAFYDRGATILAFYAEMYYTNTVVKDPSYMVRYFVERQRGNGQADLISVGNQKKRPTVIDALLVQMDISKLESGNYTLTVELRNSQNELLTAQKIDFQRSNPFLQVNESEITAEVLAHQFVQDLDEKTLRYGLKAISPLVSAGTEPEELQNIIKGGDLAAMRYFLFRFFVRRDANNPEVAWRQYMETANVVDKQFHSGFRHGFETDRGRTYMKYGRPDDMVHVEDDPAAPPYEIWVYYNFPKTQQRNVKFLFYNPTLAGDDFITLHSNARGEISNPKWERQLYRRNAGNEYGDNDFDATNMKANTNRNARRYFEDF